MLAALGAAGCSEATPTQASADPAASAATAAPTASASSAPQPTATATATPAPSAEKKESPRTPRPSLARWCRAKETFVLEARVEDDGSPGAPVCAYVMVDEWALVGCSHDPDPKIGTLSGLNPGGGSAATDEEMAAAFQNVPTTFVKAAVISLRPGTTAKPMFMHRPIEHPEWMKEKTFLFSFREGASWPDEVYTPREIRKLPREGVDCTEFDAPPPPKEPEQLEVPDVSGLEAVPDQAAWDAQKDGFFPGSDAAGCKTKSIGQWFRADCEGKLKYTGAEVERGKYATQTTFTVTDGKFSLLTPYVEGTDLRIKLSAEGAERFFKLRWSKGKRPYEIGRIDEAR